MNHRHNLGWIGFAAAILAACAASLSAAEPRLSKPNVLFIAIDDLRDWVGYLGNQQVKTPNLDRLAARGVYFTRNYCASPLCNPSRSSLLSGLRACSTGIYNNDVDWHAQVLRPRFLMLFRFLLVEGGDGWSWRAEREFPVAVRAEVRTRG